MKPKRKAGPEGRRERRAFRSEFKREAVQLLAERWASGVSLAQISRELDVRPDLLRMWTRQQAERNGTTAMPGETPE
jgi:transposase-like protein